MKKFLLIFAVFTAFIFVSPSIASAGIVDLELSSISVSPSSPYLTQDVIITISVVNSGEDTLSDMTGFDSYSYTIDNFELSSIEEPVVNGSNSLAEGQTTRYYIHGQFQEIDSNRIYFVVNANGSLSEKTQSNNYDSMYVDVVTPYDLSVTGISLEPAYLAVDQETTLTVTVKNAGKTTLYDNVGIGSYNYDFDDFRVEDKTIPDIYSRNVLESGGAAEFVFVGSFATAGEKELSFNIDVNDQLDETNEENNSTEEAITIVSVDDLDFEAGSLAVSKDSMELVKGDEVSVTVNVKNTGGFTYETDEGFLERNYQFSSGGDSDWDFPGFDVLEVFHPEPPSEDDPMNPNENITYKFSLEADDVGEGILTFRFDIHDEVAETNENNNISTSSYRIWESQDAIDEFTITDIEIFPYSTGRARITWKTSQGTTGFVTYKEKGYSGYDRFMLHLDIDEWPSSDKSVEEHSLDLEGFMAGMEYLYFITAVNEDIEKDSTITSYFSPESNNLDITTGPNLSISGTDLSFTWSTDLYSLGWLYLKHESDDSYKSYTTVLDKDHSYSLTSMATGTYEYYVFASSTPGTTAQSNVRSFTLGSASPSPPQPPAPSDNDTPAPVDDGGGDDTPSSASEQEISNSGLYGNLKGKIVLTVERNGEAYYIHPGEQRMYYLGRPDDAFGVMRNKGVGITTGNLEKIPIGLSGTTGPDSDGDGLSDIFEDAVGTDKNSADTDGDGFSDKDEISGGYNPKGSGNMNTSSSFSSGQKGKIFLQVENNGEAWYINPADGKRYFLGRPADAFSIMRTLGLGISNSNFDSL